MYFNYRHMSHITSLLSHGWSFLYCSCNSSLWSFMMPLGVKSLRNKCSMHSCNSMKIWGARCAQCSLAVGSNNWPCLLLCFLKCIMMSASCGLSLFSSLYLKMTIKCQLCIAYPTGIPSLNSPLYWDLADFVILYCSGDGGLHLRSNIKWTITTPVALLWNSSLLILALWSRYGIQALSRLLSFKNSSNQYFGIHASSLNHSKSKDTNFSGGKTCVILHCSQTSIPLPCVWSPPDWWTMCVSTFDKSSSFSKGLMSTLPNMW